MEPSDELLVLGCRNGDSAAWQGLVTRYQRLVYSIAHRSGLDIEQAADLFQRVFMLLVQHIDRIEQPARVGFWIATTARREAWQIYRSERLEVRSLNADEEELQTLTDSAPLPDEVLQELESQQSIRTAMAMLDERCRILLTMLFYRADPASYTEITLTLQIASGSIGPIRARCLQKLRRLLDDIEI